MNKNNICPCPNRDCPNNGICENCTSRHLRMGTLNHCGFNSILPFLENLYDTTTDKDSQEKLKKLMDKHICAYSKLRNKHGITQNEQNQLNLYKANFSEF